MSLSATVAAAGKHQILTALAVHAQTPVGATLRIEVEVAGQLVSVFNGQQTADGVTVSTCRRPGTGASVVVRPMANGVDRSNRASLTVVPVV